MDRYERERETDRQGFGSVCESLARAVDLTKYVLSGKCGPLMIQ